MSKEEFVRNELAKLSETTFEGDEAVILCPFHDDHTPSLRVSLVKKVRQNGKGVAPGGFHCFSCKAGGGWNRLAEKLNLQPWDVKEHENKPQDLFWGLAKELQVLSSGVYAYRKPATDGTYVEAWRELPAEFLSDIGAELLWDRVDEDYRIMLPLRNIRNELIGHVGARPDNSSIPNKRKYIMSPNFPSDQEWFCLDRLAGKTDKVVIVEGPYDTLRFLQHGIPAIGAFGVSAFTDIKMLQLVACGISKAICCLDGDAAGRNATPELITRLQRIGITAYDMDLTTYAQDGAKIDPGDCPAEVISDLQNFLKTI